MIPMTSLSRPRPRRAPSRHPIRLIPLLVVALLALAAAGPARATRMSAAPAGPPTSGPAVLVKDFDTTPYQPGFSAGSPLATIGGTLFFAGWDDGNGAELWKSDGTAAGTILVKDIAPGSRDSQPRLASNVSGTLFFFADDGSSGAELWKSDGTAAGTVLVRDINPGAAGSLPDQWSGCYDFGCPVAVGGRLYFAADDGSHGVELWISDGTAAGTHLVRDIRAGSASGAPTMLADVDGTLFFKTNDYNQGDTIWKSDGTAAGTVPLKTIPPAPFGSPSISRLFGVNHSLFFTLSEFGGLWKSDGTAAGTTLVKDLAGALILDLTPVDGTICFFSAGALWKSDGTTAGTVPVKTIDPTVSELANLINVNGTLFFSVRSDATTNTLWKSDGTAAGTVPVKTIVSSSQYSPLREFVNVNGRLFFTADEQTTGRELWTSDGSAAGTSMVEDLTPETTGLGPGDLTPVNGRLLFGLNGGLWSSDGTAAGTIQVKAGHPVNSLAVAELQNVNGTLFFTGYTTTELWRSDGTTAGTTMLKSFAAQNGSIRQLTPVNDMLFFVVSENYKDSLWKSDGTAAGTVLVKDLDLYGIRHNLTNLNGNLFFSNYGQLWRSDGTTAGTTMIKDLAGSANTLYDLTNVRGMLFFTTSKLSNSDTELHELWKSDGTSTGTTRLQIFDYSDCAYKGGCDPSTIGQLTAVGGSLFFAGQLNGHTQLWKSDGTAQGTIPLTTAAPSALTAVGDRLFFSMDDGTSGAELWASDGTPASTHRVADIRPGPVGSAPHALSAVGGTLYFAADDGQHGVELWKSNGSSSGTALVSDIVPGPAGSAPSELTDVVGTLIFSAWSPATGVELWASDGSAAGTQLLQDVAPGTQHANPARLTVAGPHLFFSANDGSAGPALWALPLVSRPFRPIGVGLGAMIQAEDFDIGGERLAYHDLDAIDRSGQYRPSESVDVEKLSTGGYYVAWTQPGEWLNYTVDVLETHTYTVELQVAAQGQGGTFHIAVDGVDRSGPLRIPDTGGWARWQVIHKTGIELAAGRHTLTLVMDSNGATWGVGNFNWINLVGPLPQRVFLPDIYP